MTQAVSLSVHPVPLEAIDVIPNPRKRIGDLSELVESIRTHGVQTPIRVRPCSSAEGRYELVYGQRRFLAAQKAGLSQVPAVVAAMTDEEVLEAQLVENGQRQDVHPMEEAEAFQALAEKFGRSVDEVAAAVGKPRSYVLFRLKLCELRPKAREAFFADKFTAQVAYLLARIPNGELQLQALELVLKGRYDGAPLTAREVQELIQRRFMLVLQNAPFDRKDETLVPDAGACGPCPKRTGNQHELFGDVQSKDVCTDPGCFQRKVEAAWTRRAEQALSDGKEVSTRGWVDGTASKAVFPYGSQLAHNSPWVDLSERCPADPKNRTWRQLLRRARLPVTVAKDGSNRPHELVERKAAVAALKALGYEFSAKVGKSGGQRVDDEERKRRQRIAEKGAVARAAIAAVVEKAGERGSDDEFWRLILSGLLRGSWHDTITDLVRRRGLAEKGKRAEEVLEAHLETLGGRDLMGIAVELIISRGAYWQHATSYGETLTRACALYGIDLPALEKEVVAQVRAERQPKPSASAA